MSTTRKDAGGSTVTHETDVVSSKHHEVLKLAFGDDATVTRVEEAVGLPVDVISETVNTVIVGTAPIDWENQLYNEEYIYLSSAARTAAPTTVVQENKRASGIAVYLNVSVASGTGGLTLSIRNRDPASSTHHTLLTSAAITTTGAKTFLVYPGATDSDTKFTGSTDASLARVYDIPIAVGDSSSYTYSVGVTLLK